MSPLRVDMTKKLRADVRKTVGGTPTGDAVVTN